MTRVRRYLKSNESFDLWYQISVWCFSQFGMPGNRQEEWNYAVGDNCIDYYFRETKSAELFILKWM